MRRIITFLCVAFIVTGIKAQIPNSSFENWSNGPNNAPDGWGSEHSSVQRSSDHFAGSYSVLVQSSLTLNDTVKGQVETVLPTDTNGSPKPVFSVNQRHTSFKGYYKYSPVAGDSAQLGCMLFKNGFTSTYPVPVPNMLALCFTTIGNAAATFTPFSVDFIYLDGGTLVPDSGWAILASYVFYRGTATNLKPQGNSSLYVDAVSFDNYVMGIQQPNDISTGFTLMPNVTNGQFEVKYQLNESGYTTLKVYDISGREMKVLSAGNLTAGSYLQSYNVNELAKGNYLLVLSNANGFHTEKLTVMQ